LPAAKFAENRRIEFAENKGFRIAMAKKTIGVEQKGNTKFTEEYSESVRAGKTEENLIKNLSR